MNVSDEKRTLRVVEWAEKKMAEEAAKTAKQEAKKAKKKNAVKAEPDLTPIEIKRKKEKKAAQAKAKALHEENQKTIEDMTAEE